jgi:hypothetical protein
MAVKECLLVKPDDGLADPTPIVSTEEFDAAGAATAAQAAAVATAAAALTAFAATAVVDGDAAGGVLAGTFPSPSFAADMATQAELDAVAAVAASAEQTANKNAAEGYAGLTASRVTKGVVTTDDLIVNAATKGLVLKDTDGHYWRASISTLGVLSWADLGTGLP